MQMREVACGIQYINKEQSQSQYLAFSLSLPHYLCSHASTHQYHQDVFRWKVGNRDPGGI